MHFWNHGRMLIAFFLFLPTTGIIARSQEKNQKFEVSAAEKEILDLTNKERANQKLPPLKPNAKLFYAARVHSKNMAVIGKFTHILDNKNPIHRAEEYGYPVPYVGENIGLGSVSPKQVVELWMNSPQHKENILKPQYNEIGIGAYKVGNGEIYWTQVFGASKEAKNPPQLVVGKEEFPEPPKPGKKNEEKPDPGKPDPGKPDPTPKPVKPGAAKVPLFKASTLTNSDTDDSLLKDRQSKIYQVHLEEGKNYSIDLISAQFDAYLFLKDDNGKTLAHDDDGGGGQNARITFTPKQTGTYQVVVTSMQKGATGLFALQVREK